LDTVSVLWGTQGGSDLLSAIQAGATVPFARGLLALDKLPSGARVMAWPEFGTVKVEARLAALADGTSETDRLGTVDELRLVGDLAAGELANFYGAVPDSAATVGRFDLVTERDCEPVEGLQLLKAMRALCPPGHKVKTFITATGHMQYVAVVTERAGRVLFRAYDKAVESGRGEPGSVVRFEAQVRKAKRDRQRPGAVADRDLGADFGRTIEPFMKGDPIIVTSPSGVVDQVAGKLAREELTAARAERLVGSAELLRRYGRSIYNSDNASARRLRALRVAGIAIDDELPPDASVPVSDLLSAALASWDRDGSS
jgi:hypothetical protein